MYPLFPNGLGQAPRAQRYDDRLSHSEGQSDADQVDDGSRLLGASLRQQDLVVIERDNAEVITPEIGDAHDEPHNDDDDPGVADAPKVFSLNFPSKTSRADAHA